MTALRGSVLPVVCGCLTEVYTTFAVLIASCLALFLEGFS
jgi:hypothetical protein